MRQKAKLRLQLEDSVRLNKSYETVFEGLKLNTPHKSAVTHPLMFLIQRLVFANEIIFMPQVPELAIFLLILMSLGVLAFTLAEKPWKDA